MSRSYNPIFFQRSDDWIPSIPDPNDPKQRYVKDEAPGFNSFQPSTARDSVMAKRELPDDPTWNMRGLKVGFDKRTGELHWRFHGAQIRASQFNSFLAEYRKQLGADAIKTNVLWLSRYTVEEQIGQLRVNGYERQEHRETQNDPCLCFVGKCRQWKE